MINIQFFLENEETFLNTGSYQCKPNKGEWIEVVEKRYYVLDVIHCNYFVKLIVGEKPKKNGKV